MRDVLPPCNCGPCSNRLTDSPAPVTETPVAFVRYKDLKAPTFVCAFCDHSMRVHNGDRCYECGADDGVCKKDT